MTSTWTRGGLLPCLRATPSGAPRTGCTPRSRASRSSRPTCAGPRSPRPTSRGRDTIEVVSRGKHLLHRVEGGLTLHSHLRMEGQWRVEATRGLAARWRRNPQLRALVSAADWTALGLRLGMLDLVPTAREGDLVGHLGPDVLGPDWDAARAVDNRRPRARADRRRPCSTSATSPESARCGAPRRSSSRRCRPWSVADELDRAVLERVVDRAHRLIDNGRDHAVQSSTGSYRLGDAHYVHARSGRPCRRCGTTVRVAPIGVPPQERTMFYCPGCQGGLGPTDDGRAATARSAPRAGRRRDVGWCADPSAVIAASAERRRTSPLSAHRPSVGGRDRQTAWSHREIPTPKECVMASRLNPYISFTRQRPRGDGVLPERLRRRAQRQHLR